MTPKKSISEIQKSEEQAEKIIQKAQEKVLAGKSQAKADGEAKLQNIPEECRPELDKSEHEIKEEIKKRVAEEKVSIEKQAKSLNHIPETRQKKAMEYIVSNFLKS